MPALKLNDSGQLVNESGEVFEIEGEAVTVEGVKTQADIDKTVKDRLAREREKYDELKRAAETVPSLQRLVDESSAKVRDLEAEAENIKATAQQESAATINKHRQEAERYKAEAQQRSEELVRYQIQNQILSVAGSNFNDPATDLVPHLLQAHKREAVKGEDGKSTGEFKDFFKLRFKNDKGEEVEDYLPVDKAIETWAASHPHHVKATGGSGSGGGNYSPNMSGMKRSEMSIEQKTDFTTKHGLDAFQKLPA